MRKKASPKQIEALSHDEASRKNIPTAEHEPLLREQEKSAVRVAYERRNPDLDPQLVWRGKYERDQSELSVQAPPLYIQEKVHPKVLIDDLRRQSEQTGAEDEGFTADLFTDFNGLPSEDAKTEFYQHDANWSNRMILGDALQVMASLAEREGLRGKVQCIYIDPPYGIKFNSNFQWSTTSRDVKDGKAEHITREPEQVKAFRDTWRDGIHSYLTYLRDRLTVARNLLTESGSIFVQIGDENVHRVRAVMDEVFGVENFVGEIYFNKTTGFSGNYLSQITDTILWYARSNGQQKYRALWRKKTAGDEGATKVREAGRLAALKNYPLDQTRLATLADLTSQGASDRDEVLSVAGDNYPPRLGLHWKTTTLGLGRLKRASRIAIEGRTPRQVRYLDDFAVFPFSNVWMDIGGIQSRTDPKVYVVQTATEAVQRCLLMTTDPGDLVLDPTCGSGTTAYVAEQWGRRWITIDTSRVALALARSRIMGARYPFHLLADSPEGERKEAALSRRPPSEAPTYGDIRQGFVCERVPHITLKSIANNAEIDVIHEQMQPQVETALQKLNEALRGNATPFEVETGGRKGKYIDFTASTGATVTLPSGESAPSNGFLEWEVPREADKEWPEAARYSHDKFWQARIARQREIDASITAKANYEYLYDKPYQDKGKVRVAGPFTVESLSPHRVLGVNEQDELIDRIEDAPAGYGPLANFADMILENLKQAGVQQARKADKIEFTALTRWPGEMICAEGRYLEGEMEKHAGIFIGPEFGTVTRPDLVAAARECGDAGFDVLIACAFSFDGHCTELNRLGAIPVLKARMNADLHMAEDLSNTGKGNLFVVFGEPDIEILEAEDDRVQVKINGVDVFHPNTGEIRSDGAEGIACWFIDTDYNEESFFVRHAYFLGANNPYKALQTTLKSEINTEVWESLNSDTSRPFAKPGSGRIAIKVINHLGDEVMKVYKV